MADPYAVLGIGRDATDDEIKTAFRNKAKTCHPDQHPNDPTALAKFQELSGAYDEIKDRKARQNHNPFADSPFGQAGSVEDLLRNWQNATRQARQKNDDIGIAYNMTLEDAYAGKTLDFELNLMRGATKVQVPVPPGVESGKRLRVVGAGQDTDQHLPRGDLYVNIGIVPHDKFHRVGPNLACEQPIDVYTAILGGTFDITTINGSIVTVNVPKGVGDGSQLRVAGHGMPMIGIAGKYGDLIILLKVTMPKDLTSEQISLFEQARDLQKSV